MSTTSNRTIAYIQSSLFHIKTPHSVFANLHEPFPSFNFVHTSEVTLSQAPEFAIGIFSTDHRTVKIVVWAVFGSSQ
jgi:hypothetical protein